MRTTVEGKTIEEHALVVGAKRVPWSYTPVGPFKVERWHVSCSPWACRWVMADTLGGALEIVAMKLLPVATGYCIEIIDESFRGVFGVSCLTGLAESLMHAWGVGAAFETAERQGWIDPIALAIWEVNARKAAPGG